MPDYPRVFIWLCFYALATILPVDAKAYDCIKKYGKQMSSCEEAVYQLNKCGFGRLDRDNDGIPCEWICGDNKRLSGVKQWSQQGAKIPQLRKKVGTTILVPLLPKCLQKKTCKEFKSCAEVAQYLHQCAGSKLNTDNRKMPCPSLCKTHSRNNQ